MANVVYSIIKNSK